MCRQMEEMNDGVKKGIMLEFNLEDYQEAYSLVKHFREEKGLYIGGFLIKKLKEVKGA